jgi:hypothetical protein
MSELYHYTCKCWAPKIAAQHLLRPSKHPILRHHGKFSWLTDLDEPNPVALGLPVVRKPCDRSQYRVAVDASLPELHRWASWSRRNIPLALRQALEVNDPKALFAHWWVALADVPILRVDDMRTPLVKEET